MLNQADNSWKAETSEQVDGGVACLVEGSGVVIGILDNSLRVSRENGHHRADNVSTLGQVQQLLGLPIRGDNKEPVFDGTAPGGRENLHSREGSACLEVVSDDVAVCLPEVVQDEVHGPNDVCMFVAGDEEDDPDLVLLLELLLDSVLGLFVEVLVAGG